MITIHPHGHDDGDGRRRRCKYCTPISHAEQFGRTWNMFIDLAFSNCCFILECVLVLPHSAFGFFFLAALHTLERLVGCCLLLATISRVVHTHTIALWLLEHTFFSCFSHFLLSNGVSLISGVDLWKILHKRLALDGMSFDCDIKPMFKPSNPCCTVVTKLLLWLLYELFWSQSNFCNSL